LEIALGFIAENIVRRVASAVHKLIVNASGWVGILAGMEAFLDIIFLPFELLVKS
jgi:hypothetical protein